MFMPAPNHAKSGRSWAASAFAICLGLCAPSHSRDAGKIAAGGIPFPGEPPQRPSLRADLARHARAAIQVSLEFPAGPIGPRDTLAIPRGSRTDLVLWISNHGPGDSIHARAYYSGVVPAPGKDDLPRSLFIPQGGRDSIHISLLPETRNDICVAPSYLYVGAFRLSNHADGAYLKQNFACLASTGRQAPASPGRPGEDGKGLSQSRKAPAGFRAREGGREFQADGARIDK